MARCQDVQHSCALQGSMGTVEGMSTGNGQYSLSYLSPLVLYHDYGKATREDKLIYLSCYDVMFSIIPIISQILVCNPFLLSCLFVKILVAVKPVTYPYGRHWS